MCRSILEHPPAGLRCDKRDHLTPQAAEAKRLARNAREKELYHLRKARKEEEKAALPLLIQREREALVSISQVPLQLADYVHEDGITSTQEERDQLANLLQSKQSDLAYLPVVDDDEKFAEENFSTNEVRRITLSDGTVGYFKFYEGAHSYDSGNLTGDYGHTHLSSSLNEIAAYRLSQIMGDGYNTLVPETVMREHDGRLGTFQVEAKGEIGVSLIDIRKKQLLEDGVNLEAWRKAAIYDYVAGTQDRHEWNYIVHETEEGLTPVLIDNGFSFKKNSGMLNIILTSTYMHNNVDSPSTLTETETNMLIRLRDSEELNSLRSLISQEAYETLQERINSMLEENSILHAADDRKRMMNNWGNLF